MKTTVKQSKKVPVKTEKVEQPPKKVTEAVSEGLLDAKTDIEKDVHEADPRVHHVANAGE